MPLPSSGTISLSQINNSGTSTVSLGDLIPELIAGNSAAGQQVSLDKCYYTQSYTAQATVIGTPKQTSGQGQGWSVALSASGNTMITADVLFGRVYMFERTGVTWTQQANPYPAGAQRDGLGWAIALSADGNTAVFGSPYSSANVGTAYVYFRTGSTWALQQQITFTGGAGTENYFGVGVALSADGNTLAVGGSRDGAGGSQSGKVWIFTRSSSTWTQQTYFTKGNNNQGFGNSLSFSADGTKLAVGCEASGSIRAVIYVYTYSGGTWTPVTVNVSAGGIATGGAVALSADGKTVLSSGGTYSGGTGLVCCIYNGTTWIQLGQLQGAPSTSYGNCAISADGNIAYGGPTFGSQNKANIFTRSGDTWSYVRTLTLPDYPYAYFGSSGAFGKNGNTLAVGAQQYPGGQGGAVIIYT